MLYSQLIERVGLRKLSLPPAHINIMELGSHTKKMETSTIGLNFKR